MSNDKKPAGEWSVFLQGGMLSLLFYLVCVAVLALVLVRGILPERFEMTVVASAAFLAAMLGGIMVSNRSSLAKLSAAMISAGVFAVILAAVGMIGWRESFWGGCGALLVACVFAGGAVAGVWGAGKRKKRRQRGRTRTVLK